MSYPEESARVAAKMFTPLILTTAAIHPHALLERMEKLFVALQKEAMGETALLVIRYIEQYPNMDGLQYVTDLRHMFKEQIECTEKVEVPQI